MTKKLYIEMDPYKIINLVRTTSLHKGLMMNQQKLLDQFVSQSYSEKIDYLRRNKKSSIILDSIVESVSIKEKYINLFSENDNSIIDDELLHRNRVRLAKHTLYVKPKLTLLREEGQKVRDVTASRTYASLENLSQYATDSLLSKGLYPYRDHDYDAYFKQDNDDLEPIILGVDEQIIHELAVAEFG